MDPVIPRYDHQWCSTLNFTLDRDTYVDNIILSAKYYRDEKWEIIYKLSEDSVVFNNNSRFYLRLDKNKVTANSFCFQSVVMADKLIDFQWTVLDLNNKRSNLQFDFNYNGRLDGHTVIKNIDVLSDLLEEKQPYCLLLDYTLNYEAFVWSLQMMEFTVNSEKLFSVVNNSFQPNAAFTQKSFYDRVDWSKTHLNVMCVKEAEILDSSLEFKWHLRDWTYTDVHQIYYLPGLSKEGNFSIVEKYDDDFDLGSRDLCLTAQFILPQNSTIDKLFLMSRRARYDWKVVLLFLPPNIFYNDDDNIIPASERGNGFCFKKVTEKVIHQRYKWKLYETNNENPAVREFNFISKHWNIEEPKIFVIQATPPVSNYSGVQCLTLKYSYDPHAELQAVQLGTNDDDYMEIFELHQNHLSYNENHPLVKHQAIVQHLTHFDHICFDMAKIETYSSFRWTITDSYEQTTAANYTLSPTHDKTLSVNVSEISFTPEFAKDNEPLCITLYYTSHQNNSVAFEELLPGQNYSLLLYKYSYESGNSTFCEDSKSEICHRIDQNKTHANTICFKTVNNVDSYRDFIWNVNEKFNYHFAFDVFDDALTNPNLTVLSRQSSYSPNDKFQAQCAFEGLSANPRLSWYINNIQLVDSDVYYSHSNFNPNNSDWTFSGYSELTYVIPEAKVNQAQNLLLTCEVQTGYESNLKNDAPEYGYKRYKTNYIISITDAKNNNHTKIISAIVTPPVYVDEKPACLVLNYTTETEIISISLVQTHSGMDKVAYLYEDGRTFFPDKMNFTKRIDKNKTNKNHICLSKVERIDDGTYQWVVTDKDKNYLKYSFDLETYELPQTLKIEISPEKNSYHAEDLLTVSCVAISVRPKAAITFTVDGETVPFNETMNSSYVEPNGTNYVSVFVLPLTQKMLKNNKTDIVCQLTVGENYHNSTNRLIFFQHQEPSNSTNSNGGLIAGVIIVTIIAFILSVAVVFLLVKRRSPNPESEHLIQG